MADKIGKMRSKEIDRIKGLSIESKSKLMAIWMSNERLKGTKTLLLMFDLDDEWQRVYGDNRSDGFTAARMIANEHILNLIYSIS